MRKLTALACALVAAVATMGAGVASAAPAEIQGFPALFGVKTLDESNLGQCTPTDQEGDWSVSPRQTKEIRLDTDNRPGGCQLSFALADFGGSLAGLKITYQLMPEFGSHSGQCGENWRENPIPIGTDLKFGDPIRIDSDNRTGWCNLTFAVTGRPDIRFEVLFYPDGRSEQCGNWSDNWRRVEPGQSLTLNLDMDDRAGGCRLALRLVQ